MKEIIIKGEFTIEGLNRKEAVVYISADNPSSQVIIKWSGREDLNLRPPDPQSGALPGCATPRLQAGKPTYNYGECKS